MQPQNKLPKIPLCAALGFILSATAAQASFILSDESGLITWTTLDEFFSPTGTSSAQRDPSSVCTDLHSQRVCRALQRRQPLLAGAPGFFDTALRASVDITSADAFSLDVLQNLYQTEAGDAPLSRDTRILPGDHGETLRLGTDAVSIDVNSVPEPRSLFLLGLPLLAISLFLLRRRRPPTP